MIIQFANGDTSNKGEEEDHKEAEEAGHAKQHNIHTYQFI